MFTWILRKKRGILIFQAFAIVGHSDVLRAGLLKEKLVRGFDNRLRLPIP